MLVRIGAWLIDCVFMAMILMLAVMVTLAYGI